MGCHEQTPDNTLHFHGGDRGSNPRGDAGKIKGLEASALANAQQMSNGFAVLDTGWTRNRLGLRLGPFSFLAGIHSSTS